jgi:ABC-type transport system involved in multi-copper enzyme maturation permease subunit
MSTAASTTTGTTTSTTATGTTGGTTGAPQAGTRTPARDRAVPAPIPFTRVLGVELRKMFDTRSGFWLMASIVLLSVIATGAVIVFAPSEEVDYEAFASAIGIPMTVILPIIAVLSVSSEWSQRSALTTFTLVPSRTRVITGKALLTVAVGVVSMVVALGVGAIGNVAGSALAGVDQTWNVSPQEFAQILLADQVGMLMGFMLGVLLRSSPAAIVGYFVYALVLPGISGALANANDWWHENGAWIDLNWATNRLYDNTLTGQMWAQLATAALVWLVVPLVIGLRTVRRAEVK